MLLWCCSGVALVLLWCCSGVARLTRVLCCVILIPVLSEVICHWLSHLLCHMQVRSFLDSIGLKTTRIIPKMATRMALINFPAILKHSDGIMINRGTLGLDCLPEKMALVQKTMIKVSIDCLNACMLSSDCSPLVPLVVMQACNLVGKPVILSRLVDTMINTPRPTRAEATDIANAGK